ncbi:hypothetical protein MHYP_G00016760 [Metynnis hypsauchen]
MMKWTFDIISSHFSKFSKAAWIDWFGCKLVPLLPSLTAEMLTTTIAEVDCATYHVIVEGLNMAFEEMTLMTKQEITRVLVEYLKVSQEVDGSGLSCGSHTKSSSGWLWVNFGKYSIYVSLQDLQLLNPEFSKFASVEHFTVSQVCDLTVQSGALQNIDLIKVVLNHLGKGNVWKNLEELLASLRTKSQNLQINCAVRDIMMKWTFDIISSHFSKFSKAEWIDWFGSKLVPLLPSLTTEMLTTTITEVDCATYHVIIEGLNMAFEEMTLMTKQEITRVLVEYLKVSQEVDGSGLHCGSGTNSAGGWLWVNFGKYSIYVSLQDLQLLNHEFSKTLEINPVVRDIMMKWTFDIISNHFSKFSKPEWIDWFGSKLVPLLPSLTTEMLTITITEVDCATYHVIVEGLNMAFEEMTPMTKQEFTRALVKYLKVSQEVDGSGLPCGSGTNSAGGWLWVNFGKYSIYVSLQDLQLLNYEFSKFASLELFTVSQVCDLTIQSGALQNIDLIKVVLNHLGLPCGSGTKSSSGWLWVNFGKYSIYVSLQDLQLLNHEFSKFASVENFTVSQVCDLTVQSGALQNIDLINVVLNHLDKGNIWKNLEKLMVSLGRKSQTLQINPAVRDIMMKWTFNMISSNFSKFSKAAWIDWFGSKLVPLLPSLTAEMLTITITEVDCATYHVIIEGLNMAFEEMALMTKQEIVRVLVKYLKVSQDVNTSGLPCGSHTNSASGWLWVNFGKFSIYVSLQDLQLLNHEFSKFASVELFTLSQVCDLTVQSGALQNIDLIKVVLNYLRKGNVWKNLEKLLVSLGTKSQNLQIHPVVRDIMMKWTFDIISSHFSMFSNTAWIDWFGSKLVPLLPSLTAEMLTITIAEVDCATYHIIIEGLNMGFDEMTLMTKQETTCVLVDYLKVSQEVDGSGLPCGSGTNSASGWLWVNFGKYSIYVTLQDLQFLNHEFSKNLPINHAVRDIMMKWTFNIISSHFSKFSKVEWIDWFGNNLVPLLPSLTTEMLKITIAEVDCATYHEINWLLVNFGKFSIYVSVEDLQSLTIDFSWYFALRTTTRVPEKSSASLTSPSTQTTALSAVPPKVLSTAFQAENVMTEPAKGEGVLTLHLRMQSVFISAYNNTASAQYITLANNITSELDRTYQELFPYTYLRCHVLRFWYSYSFLAFITPQYDCQ